MKAEQLAALVSAVHKMHQVIAAAVAHVPALHAMGPQMAAIQADLHKAMGHDAAPEPKAEPAPEKPPAKK